MGLELLGTGAGAGQGLEQLIAQRRADELMRQQALMHAMSAIGLREDRQARLGQQKSQADALAEARNQTNKSRQQTVNLQQLQALPMGTDVGPASFARLTNPETGATPPESFDMSPGTPASLPSVSLSGMSAIGPRGPEGMAPQTQEPSRKLDAAFRFKGTAQQQAGADERERKQQMADAAISARVEGLNQAAERLKMQGQMNEANILLAQARAEAAQAKAAADAGKSGAGEAYTAEKNRRTIESVDALMGKVNRMTTGVGSLMSGIPESPARNFSAELNTLKSNIAFGELAAMRAASKTGGALGAVSERELKLLESSLGALDTGQSPENIKAQLQKIKDSIGRWNAAQGGAVKPMPSHGSAPKLTAEELIRKYGG